MDKKGNRIVELLILFTVIYLIFFTFIAFFYRNYEFMFYSFVMALLIVFAILKHKEFNLNLTTIILLISILILHALGCNVYIAGTKLYDTWIIQGILRYDNVIHFYGGIIAALLVYNWLIPNMNKNILTKKTMLFLILLLTAMGLEAFNELSEFSAFVMFTNTGVGDYVNNSLDFFFNLLGSSIMLIFLIMRRNSKK